MSWQKELDQILSRLGVQQEYSQGEQNEETFFLISQSPVHQGVCYRMDLANSIPELRVSIPGNGPYKLQMYRIQLAPGSFLLHLFDLCLSYQGGSQAFQEAEGCLLYQMLVLLLHMMVELFWQGDLHSLCFPDEIEVVRLL